ncbi:hypothetical protein SPO2485 [Ruegeria pomeroyi DSS-3]|uniref:Uncharacterized protein n=1 Tax=Ruegeria pomeroyi (strain ATCC 700808 / DSM 15171 / DSS-3) TaxID=246200 RepID=Q5LQK4_RUEPO|nr:hypothetical protein [Ruegeria pomeroyi]AAV95738.1 hypothetical protein SPO2485 [Ruegeria pomeroyi DSS-3]
MKQVYRQILPGARITRAAAFLVACLLSLLLVGLPWLVLLL